MSLMIRPPKNNTETGGGGNFEKSPFLFKNIQSDVLTKLLCSALTEILKRKTKIVEEG